MLTLVNTNRMSPPIAPIGLDYVAGSVREAGYSVELLDLGLAEDPQSELLRYLERRQPDLVGFSFRNVDDCFWPSARWFVPDLAETVNTIRALTDSPIVIGGVGFSIFAKQIVEYTDADFGICGDGEQATAALLTELKGRKRLEKVDGLIWRSDGKLRANKPAWPTPLSHEL